MRINGLTIRDFRNLTLVEMSDLPDLVVLAGANGCGKTAVFDAIVLAKEVMGSYGGLRADPRQVNVAAQSAEIDLSLGTSQEERDTYSELPHVAVGRVRLRRDGGLEVSQRPPGSHDLLSTYNRKTAPQLGVLEYFPAARVLTPKTVSDYRSEYANEDRWRSSATSRERSRFDDIKEYMAALAFQSAQTVERRIVVDGEVIGPETYTDSFAEFRDVFSRFFAPMRFERVRISTAPFQYVISTPSGEIDLDDLSDGEKAVFTMVFDIIRRDIRNSVILIDEPELHLHPDLAVKLAQLLPTIRPDNQIWLATQCAEIVRKVPTESVYRVAKVCDGLNSQAQRIFSSDDMRATLAELVGNLGLVTLNRRTVFLEGTEQSIDRHILETLYADRLSEVQFVPCGPVESVNKVSDKVLQLLQEASEFNYFYAIRDRDFMTSEDALRLEREGRGRLFVWDRYHIENYLLDGPVLLAATRALAGSRSPFGSPEEVMARCREIASDMVPGVVAKRLDLHVRFTRPVPRASTDPSRPLDHSREVMEAMIEVAKDSCKDLPAVKEQAEQALLGALSDNSWVSVFPGRDILRRLAGELSVGYEELRNVAVAQLSAPPQGIAHVMSAILAA